MSVHPARLRAARRLPYPERPLGVRTDEGRPWSDRPARPVEWVRARLLLQRAFRQEQLEELEGLGADDDMDEGLRQVRRTLRAAAQAALSDVETALERIDRGSYGVCADCGDPIAAERLDAVPSAPLCNPCHRDDDRSRARIC